MCYIRSDKTGPHILNLPSKPREPNTLFGMLSDIYFVKPEYIRDDAVEFLDLLDACPQLSFGVFTCGATRNGKLLITQI